MKALVEQTLRIKDENRVSDHAYRALRAAFPNMPTMCSIVKKRTELNGYLNITDIKEVNCSPSCKKVPK